ncbi:MAG: hypothetical protein UGF89_12990 [Acutalibacteraceae bacterium]|nr:hypothetical protein [Acutalibacteraceae bacterium]
MTKRLLSLAFALLFAIGIIPFGSINSVAAKDETYSVTKALKYAKKNWNNGVGLCADFASKCLQAGGVDVYGETVIDLYNQLKGEYGDAYRLKLTNGTSGKISMSANDGKLEKGDPIFYKCNYCGDFEHVVICNGENGDGYSQDYAHNNAHNGKKTTYTYRHCGGESWTMYSIRMYEGPKLYGKKTSVGVPAITSVENGADGVVVKWSSVKGADKYYLYRKTEKSSWKKIKTTKKSKIYTDTKAKNDTRYTYMVKAVDGKKVSQYYAGEKITCLGAPKVTAVENNTSSVKISWNKVSSADGYYVYRKGNSGSWKQIAKVKGGKKVNYTDKKVSCSETYKYTVRAYDGKVKGCYNDDGIKTIFLKNPAGLNVENGELGLVLSFNKIKAAKGYEIYRKVADGKWEKLSSLVGKNATSFIDLDVVDGKEYSYSVKAINGKYSSCFNSAGVKCEYLEPIVEETTDSENSQIPQTTEPTDIPETTEVTENEEVVA